MKRVLSLMMALALLLGAMAAAEERPRVAISCPYGSTDWIAAVNRCAEATAEALEMNYMLKLATSEAEQAEDLEMMVEQGYSYIVLFPVGDGVEAAAKRAMKAGAVLLCFADVPGELEPDYSLCFDEAQAGAQGAAFLGEQLGGQGRVALVALESDEAAAQRVAACRDALEEGYPGIEIAGTFTAVRADAETGDQLMREILAEHEQIDGVFSCDDALSVGMLGAMEALGRLGDGGVKVLSSCGGSRAFLDCMDARGDSILLTTQIRSPAMMGELLRICDGLTRGEAPEAVTVVPVEALDRASCAAWMAGGGAPY